MRGTTLLLFLVALVGSPCLAQWLVGQEGTSGGNSPGQTCKFPFIYKGLSHNECITTDNNFIPWCATTGNYDTEKQWGRCLITIKANRTRNGNAGKSSCSLPFDYKGKTYENCTSVDNPSNKPWCATSPNYGRDKRWAECVRYSDISTTGGNVPAGTKCNFPFWYGNQRFHGCISTNNRGIGWCAVTDNYNDDRLWGNCVVTTLKEASSSCPNGNTYEKKDNTLSYGGTSRPKGANLEDCKKECDTEASCIGFDFDRNPGVDRCYIHLNQANFNVKETTNVVSVDQYTLIKRCGDGSGADSGPTTETGKPVFTRGGNAGPGNRCSFPFTYKGHKHVSCTSQGWYTPWCGVTEDYDRDTNWGECSNIPTV